MSGQDLGAVAREIIDSNLYMTIATADRDGLPWASPVYYAPAGYTHFHWVSSPESTHSRNLAARPDVGIVVFDSRAPISTGQAVYMSGVAAELDGHELERGIEIFSRVSQTHGGRPWTPEDVRSPAPLRLYRASATEHSVLDPAVVGFDRRTPVSLS
jgi:nitroimidazol reductase NimA-like FMN-containing flavoprotein (pyridoxamine 5'-phosphate oxidase superfamily)